MDITVQFHNQEQEQFYYSTARNQLFSGGFNNGKTWVGCLKSQSLLNMFPGYKIAIGREKYTDLKRTTMQTFFKNCQSELIAAHNEQDGYTALINGSVIHWIHCDSIDENTARGLEVNSILIDQAEETQEKVHDVLDARIGRWDGVAIPPQLLELHERMFGHKWPQNKFGKWIVPSYYMNLCNPDTEFHYLYRKYHPDSPERNRNYFYIEGTWQRE